MATCFDVANYFLRRADDNAGDLISNLKLQKLVYYAQGYHLALFGKPLFNERIEAWMHGPVIPEMYYAFKQFGDGPVFPNYDFDAPSVFNQDELNLLDEVYQILGQFSAWRLRDMTQGEHPWKDTSQGEEITHDSLESYFKTQLIND